MSSELDYFLGFLTFERQKDHFRQQHREAESNTPNLFSIVKNMAKIDREPYKIRILNPVLTYETVHSVVIFTNAYEPEFCDLSN